MLIGVLSILMTFVFRAPVLMFGFLFSGRLLVVAPLLAAQFAAGVGLLKMKLWGRTLAICVLFFGMLNIVITILVPGSQSRWDQAMQTIYSQWGFPSFVPQFSFSNLADHRSGYSYLLNRVVVRHHPKNRVPCHGEAAFLVI